jgi:hypothetical protein
MPEAASRESPAAPRHEVGEVSGRRIGWTAAALVAMLGIVALAAWAVLAVLRGDRATPVASPPAAAARMPHPRLQSEPSRDLDALRKEKTALLHEYRWLDRDAGVVRIPIERAMELLAARSGATRHPAESTAAVRPAPTLSEGRR